MTSRSARASRKEQERGTISRSPTEIKSDLDPERDSDNEALKAFPNSKRKQRSEKKRSEKM